MLTKDELAAIRERAEKAEREMESAYRDASRLTTRLLEQESKTRAVMRERDEALAKLEDAKIANTVHIADADLYREAEVAKHEAKIAIEERDAALAEVARMRPVVEAAVFMRKQEDEDDYGAETLFLDALYHYMEEQSNG